MPRVHVPRWGNARMARARKESKFEVYGEEMLEKVVAKSGSSGRVYLPPDWIGKRVKVIRVD
jgi:putative transposon-encoded protein